ncbi:hypothetical protein D5045_09060 [Verminephrobacter eiseniae]|uniref:SwmB domain-containing protein n=1 Tax=Verminephrobacter eiseniae TaxID=364317 RepID=UPI002A4ED82D|nr:hypothetical protein [Verminephrobacter eiseniae]
MATSDNSSAPLVASTSGATLPVTTLPVTTTQGNRAVSSFTPTMTIDVVDGGQDAGTSGASTQGNRAVSFAPTMTIDVDGGLDQTAPVLITRDADAPKVSGDKLVLRYTEANTLGTAHPDPAAHAFAVTVNGRTNPVTDVAVDSQTKTVTLTLTRPVTGGEDVSVTYTKPTDNSKAIQDAVGNIADDITAPFRVNSGTDTTAPTLVTDTVAPPRIGGGGKELVLTYEEANYLKAVQVPKTAFAVLVNGTPNDVTAVKVDGGQDKTVTLMLSSSVPSGADVSIAYTPPGESTEAIQDTQGNPAAGTLEPMHVDSGRDQTAPVLDPSGLSTVSGDKLVLRYSEANLLGTAHPDPAAHAFAVTVNGRTNPVTDVAVDSQAKTVTLTLTRPVTGGEDVSVAYTKPADSSKAIQDAVGNIADDITAPLRVNSGTDTTAPTLVADTVAPPRIGGGGKQLVLTYEDANYLKAVQVPKTAFAVLVNGTPNDVTAVEVDGGQDKTVTLTLSRSVPSGADVSIAYTPPGESTEAIQDRQGNPAAGTLEPMHVDSGRDQTAPVLDPSGLSTVSGDKLVLRYSEANLLGTAHPDPAAHAFAVTVNGRTNPVTDVAVDSQAKTVTLTLTRPVTGGEDVSVAYTKPADSSKAIQDAVGNIADDITAPLRVNSGTDTTAPTLVADTVAPPRIGGGGKQLVLTYEDANYLKAVQVPKTAFAVLVNGTPNDVTAVKVDGGQDKTVTLTLSRSVPSGADVSITYTPPGESTEAIQDRQGNPAAGILEPVHVDSGRDQTAPVLITHGDDAPKLSGNKLVLSYDEDNNLDTVHKAVIGSFTVFVDKQTNPVTEVSVANAPAKTVTLTLADAVARGVPVTVAYQATPGNAIQDMAGNRALDITEPMIHVDNGEAPTDPAQTAGTSGTGTPGTTAHDAGTSGVITTGATPPDASTSGTGTPGTGTSGTTAPDAGTPGVVTTGVTPHDSGTPGTGTPGTGTPGTGTPGTGTPGTGTSGTGTLGTGTPGTGTPGTGTPGTGTSGTGTPGTSTPGTGTPGTGTSGTGTSGTGTSGTGTPGTGTPGTGTPGTGTPGTGTPGTTAHDAGTSGVITTGATPPDASTPGTGTGTPGTTAPDASAPGVITTGATPHDAGTPGASASGATPHDTGTPGAGTTTPGTGTPGTTAPDAGTPGTGTPGTTAPDASAPSPSANSATPSPPSDSTPSSGSPSTADVLDIVSQFSMVGNQANDQTPATPVAPVAGDRNADGVLDRTQPAVHSISVTPNANAPGSLADTPSGLVTLVNDSQDGKVRPGSQERITSLEQKDAPAQLPKGMEMPIGLLHAQVTQAVDSGHPASLSLFVALALNVNELWVQDNGTGVWTNLASAPYGGKTVLADGQLRLDIHIDDGGPFDADGKVDGVVSVVGAAAHMPLSIVGQAPDVAQHGFWF